MGEFLTANDRKMKDILFVKDTKFIVPKYQRPYTWGGDNIEQLWTDVFEEESSFLGTFIFTKEKADQRIEIIDGQQRLLTITILMAVLRDVAKETGDKVLAGEIHQDCIADKARSGEFTNRVECGESLKKFFEKYIQAENGAKEIEKLDLENISAEESLVIKNYNSLKSKVIEKLNTKTEKEAKIKSLRDSWIKIADLTVIKIEVTEEDEAYSIFETVNARGEDLSVADLLKNLLFKKIKAKGESLDQAKEQWKAILKNLSEAQTETTKFIRKFWLSKQGFLSEKKLYRAIRKQIPDYSQFLTDLENASKDYKLLLSGDKAKLKEIYGNDGLKIFDSLFGFKAMEVNQCYTLFLAILRNKEKIKFDVSHYFKIVEDFTFNYSTVCNLPTNKVERRYSEMALKIEEACSADSEKNVTKNVQRALAELMETLEGLRPNYETFEKNFLKISYKPAESLKIKYILLRINQRIDSGEIDWNTDNVNIEHLLPQEPEKWGYKKADVQEFVDNIGNLTLISKSKNSQMQNEPLETKMETLKTSKVEMTKKLVQEICEDPAPWDQRWNEGKIRAKAKEYSKFAYENVWNFKKLK